VAVRVRDLDINRELKIVYRKDKHLLAARPTRSSRWHGTKMGLRWWRDVLILSQPKRYFDDR